jgi:hypothetical protein
MLLTFGSGRAFLWGNSEVVSRRSPRRAWCSVSGFAQASAAGQEGERSREWGVEFFVNSAPLFSSSLVEALVPCWPDTVISKTDPSLFSSFTQFEEKSRRDP